NSRDGQNTVGWANLAPMVLAETCYSPTDAPDEFDLQFDNTKDWTTGEIDVQIDLQSVALHEFGHALGLAHTRDGDAVMVAQGVRGRLRRELTADDLA